MRFGLCLIIKEKIGEIKKTWSDFTSLNHWVVRDYYRLVNSVNEFERQIQRLSDEAVGFFFFVINIYLCA